MQPDLPWSGRSPQAKHCSNTAAQWWIVFGLPETASLDQVEDVYRRMAREQHPDAGGTHEGMARLNEARANARKALAVCV